MHMMGKVGVGLVALAALASTILTAKFIQVRDSYTKKLSTSQGQLQTLRPKIVDLNRELTQLESERFRAKELWGDYLTGVPTVVQAGGSGVVVANIGMNNGIREKQTLYGFEILPDGKMAYRGDFTVVTARDVQSQLQPNWGVRPEDVQTWQPQANWRWRLLIPPTYQPTFDEQILAIAKADDVLNDRKAILQNEIMLEAQAKEQLALREAELVGGDQLPKDPMIAPEFREGLVAAIEQVEEERNQVLLKVDALRHKLREKQQQVDRIKQENTELARKLPQPGKNAAAFLNK